MFCEVAVPSNKTYVSNTGNNGKATGFVAEFEADNANISRVIWKVTSGGKTRATAGMSYGGTVTGPVRIGLVVMGLYDANATAICEKYVEYIE